MIFPSRCCWRLLILLAATLPQRANSFLLCQHGIVKVQLSSGNPRLCATDKSSIDKLDSSTTFHDDGGGQQQTFSVEERSHDCSYCGIKFASRNAMFKHLRSSSECHQRANIPLPPSGADFPKRTIAIQFGYNLSRKSGYGKLKPNEMAAEAIRNAFVAVWQDMGVDQIGMTHCSAARFRHIALAQEEQCGASCDVVAINYRAAVTVGVDELMERMQAHLENRLQDDGWIMDVRVLDIESVPTSAKFHAEKDCTQRVYHYLLPLHWLKDDEDAKEWLLERSTKHTPTSGSQESMDYHQRRGKAPSALLTLKESLRLASSRTAWNRKERRSAVVNRANGEERNAIDDDNTPPVDFVTSAGRFGSLWRKERRCLHNFADPALGGLASPNTETVWRSVDRATSVDVLTTATGEGETNVTLVIELRGDGFLTEEVRRIIASTVAVSNGWLPANFFEMATRPDVMIETPLAPEGRIYLSGARFHFQEEADGLNLFNVRGEGSKAWLDELQSQLMHQRQSDEAISAEMSWLTQLRDVQAPRIRAQIEQLTADDVQREKRVREQLSTDIDNRSRGDTTSLEESPPVYQQTLSLLRQVVRNGQWPVTSAARSRVIRATPGLVTSASSVNVDATLRQVSQCGSFTLVNEDKYDGPVPLGNQLFPDLVKAIFELEEKLAHLLPCTAEGTHKGGTPIGGGIRPPSSHCAVNRNAEFTPHVDSGRGEGQSLSLLVGLGDFVGGGLVVDSKSYNVRYAPLEFDGWKQIHYTEPFAGEERFSLVWFTPERRNVQVD